MVSQYNPYLFIYSKYRIYLTLYINNILLFTTLGPYIEEFRLKLLLLFNITKNKEYNFFLGIYIKKSQY